GRLPQTVLAGFDQRRGTLSGARSDLMTAVSADMLWRTPGSSHKRRIAATLRTRLCTAIAVAWTPAGSLPTASQSTRLDRPTAPVTAHQSARSGFMFLGAVSKMHADRQVWSLDR